MSNLARILVIALSLLGTSIASAADTKIDAATVRAAQTAVERLAKQIERNTLTRKDSFKKLIEQVTGYKSLASNCISSQQAESDSINQQTKALGPAVKGES